MQTHDSSTSKQHKTSEDSCALVFTTEEFRTTPSEYLRHALKKRLLSAMTIAAIPLLASIIASLYDIRWLFVALIILFLLLPTAIMIIYLSELLTPEARQALAPKTVRFEIGKAISITDLPISEESTVQPPKHIPWSELTGIALTDRKLVITAPNLSYPLLIPLGAISSEHLSILCSHHGNTTCQPT